MSKSLHATPLKSATREQIRLLMAGVVVGFIAAMWGVVVPVTRVFGEGSEWWQEWAFVDPSMSLLPVHVLVVVAVFFLTARLRDEAATPWRGTARWLTSVATFGAIGLIFYADGMHYGSRFFVKLSDLAIDLLWLSAVGALVVHVSRIAQRVPDDVLTQQVRRRGAAFVASSILLTITQNVYVMYFIFAWLGTLPPSERGLLHDSMLMTGYIVTVLWLVSIICCAAAGVTLFLRLRRVQGW